METSRGGIGCGTVPEVQLPIIPNFLVISKTISMMKKMVVVIPATVNQLTLKESVLNVSLLRGSSEGLITMHVDSASSNVKLFEEFTSKEKSFFILQSSCIRGPL
ncbi:hypothetical protein HELRODRAFT_176356 [Helobdella robusta]|uniref:Uncharacterized protein n=1 Tax=Helobdella robusta TaxID=6412 RepID=T1FAF7_HELRO|nr:hypothetical protein HELRODRAFT_176356 [Helobdella robusta]ESO00048.1 hypothetical protein HELRODRAFT_176356 [Helobdella robusta]